MPELDAAVAPKPASAVPSPAVSSASSTSVPSAALSPAAALLRPLDSFARRHLGSSSEDIARMLDLAGYPSLDALIDAAVPADIRLQRPLRLPAAVTESEALAELTGIAAQNDPLRSYIGQGYYGTLTPAVIQRNILENPGWYTAYTPYQAEIAQGRMEALINFQTMVCDLTGLEIANASMLDEATAAAEAMHLCLAAKGDEAGGARRAFFVAQDCHPQTVGVIKTRAVPLGVEVVVGDPFSSTNAIDERFFGALVQYPGTDGAVRDYAAFVESAHAAGALVVAAADPLALCVLRPPGEWGADVAVGSTQRFGVPMGGGGPHAAYFATRDEFKRLMPGRLVGISKDSHGKPAYRLSLQTREQHIRRDKATSNICTAQVLLAVMASMYAVYHGPEGLRKIAHRVRLLTGILADELRGLGYEVGPKDSAFFDTLTVRAGSARITEIHNRAEAKGINLRRIDASTLGISLDETVDLIDLQDLWQIFHGGEAAGFDPAAVAHKLEADASTFALPDFARRESPVLTHDVFNRCHTETEMLRYVRRLESRDLSLTHSMIPLGSCTMKLNATTEMFPVTWTEFGGMHPFAPPEQTAGYRALSHTLEKWLAEITGFAAVSLQPNAGSQGEYAGLLAIHRYHESRGESERDICLIPTSAHGTNPASASMAGLKVVTIKCDAQGNIDLADLRAQAGKHAARLSCLMVTYPSTHGVFEAPIREICAIIHERGGQVYMDGANMNAQVGLCRPGDFGADVCHLNLHKTFCIPHGGGGPGVGPIGVAAHLVPFLPGDPREGDSGAVSAAPLGSASILVIPWLYIAMMGPDGLTQATKLAILNANYIARQLEPHYPVLYRGAEGHVAHECILDLRGFKATAGIEVEDVAKRLMDYGFHAPTISWPVAGTMMVEPTESESKAELDRFCDAMIAIRQEIRAIETGESDRKDNVLKNAPHTAASVTADEWPHAYPRSLAAYPAPWTREHKFWPAIGRVDNVYGDRNLVCTCLPMEAYGEDS